MTVELAHDEVRAWLTLLRAPALGAAGIRELLGRHGNAGASLSAARRDDRVPESARRWIAAPDGAVLDADLDWLAAPSHHLITCASVHQVINEGSRWRLVRCRTNVKGGPALSCSPSRETGPEV